MVYLYLYNEFSIWCLGWVQSSFFSHLNNNIFLYHNDLLLLRNQRQSGTSFNKTHVGLCIEAAKWAIDVSQVITRSKFSIRALLSWKSSFWSKLSKLKTSILCLRKSWLDIFFWRLKSFIFLNLQIFSNKSNGKLRELLFDFGLIPIL